MVRHTIAIILLCFIASSAALKAQTIKAEVVFHTDRLSMDSKEFIDGLDDKLTELIHDYTWTDNSYRYELPVRVEVYFEKYSRSAAYYRFGSGIMVALRSGIQMRDKRWDWRYSRDESLRFGEPYHPLTGMIEFYIWVCLGFEADRFAPLGGQPFYEKARLIAENARYETEYNAGWDYRRDLIRDFTGETYRDIRTAAFHIAAGEYYLNKNEIDNARSHLNRGVELALNTSPKQLELHRDDHIIRFVDIDRLAASLNEVEARDLLDRLAEWDPDNAKVYK